MAVTGPAARRPRLLPSHRRRRALVFRVRPGLSYIAPFAPRRAAVAFGSYRHVERILPRDGPPATRAPPPTATNVLARAMPPSSPLAACTSQVQSVSRVNPSNQTSHEAGLRQHEMGARPNSISRRLAMRRNGRNGRTPPLPRHSSCLRPLPRSRALAAATCGLLPAASRHSH